MIKFPIYGQIKNVPNHQRVNYTDMEEIGHMLKIWGNMSEDIWYVSYCYQYQWIYQVFQWNWYQYQYLSISIHNFSDFLWLILSSKKRLSSSGKYATSTDGMAPEVDLVGWLVIGKSTINGSFSIAMLNYQRVWHIMVSLLILVGGVPLWKYESVGMTWHS